MATATVAPETVVSGDRWGQAWQVARWLTLGLYVVTLLGALVGGARAESYADLRSALERGAVDQVRVEGALDGLGGSSVEMQGVSTVRLEWQDGWHRSSTEIRQVSSLAELRSQGFDDSSGDYIIGNVGLELRRLAPGLEIVRAEWPSDLNGSFAGWEVRGAWAFLPLALLVACIFVLVNSPQPRLATRWGWAWLMLSPAILIALPAYLILGAQGQIPGRRRLTGVGAFLILVLLVQ